MKILFTIIITVVSFSIGYSQNESDKLLYGIGYGYIQDGSGDIPGQTFYFSGISKLNKSFSLSGRLLGTYIENTERFGQYQTFEKSNGGNIELDLNFHLRFGVFDLYPSIGPSLRYSDDQHIDFMSVSYDQFGRPVDFEVSYDVSKGLRLGYSLGLNTDFYALKNIILGSRLAGIAYLDGNQYWYIAISFRHKKWKL